MRLLKLEADLAIELLRPCTRVVRAPELASNNASPSRARTVAPRCHPPAEYRRSEVTRAKVVGCERLARQWHARGQGFNSPQLHPRSEALSAVDPPEPPASGQQIGSNLLVRVNGVTRTLICSVVHL